VVTIRYRDDRCELAPGQSVLDALLERGHDIPHSCRNGTCQTCLMRTVEGTPPADSQKDLGPALRLRGHFLACVCRPDEDLTVSLPAEGESTLTAVVRRLEPLNADILRVELAVDEPFDYRAGQLLNLFMDEMLGRSYSLASVPELDEYLELHVRRLPDGRVSGWIHDELRVGQTLAVRGPGGNCFYMPGQPEKPLLLIGSAGMAISLATMAFIFGTAPQLDGTPQLSGAEGPIALIAANLFVIAFGMSWGPVVWVLLGEMFPNRIRAAALGLAAAGQWAANWLITVSFPELRNHLGLAYGFYALCAFLSLAFVWRWVRETKGVALEDMQGELAGNKPAVA
jgi:ferredoxin